MFSLESPTINWSSKKQSTIALLRTEAEYMGATMATCEVAWLQMLLADLGQSVHVAVFIYCDNISSIMLVNNPMYHARTKHIKVHYHLVREKALARDIDLVYVSTKEQWLISLQRHWAQRSF